MKLRIALPSLLLAAFANLAQAQDSTWHYFIQPYVMFPNMKGETGIGNLPPVHVDEDPQDIFSNLQMGAMLYFEAHNDQWAFSSDVLYMDLEADISQRNVIDGGSAGVSQLGWELAAMRRLTPWFELGLGLTYNRIDANLDINFSGPLFPPTVSRGLTEDWIDPTFVARATFPINDQWFFQLRGNLGGFGIGSASDLNVQVQADVTWRKSDRWSFTFGYRLIDIDYDQGQGNDRFIYDMQTFGPVLKVGYSF